MPSPNPAGYYSLNIPKHFEEEISRLNQQQLARTNWNIAAVLDDVIYECMEINEDSEFESDHLSPTFDKWVLTLSTHELISLQRWIADLLASNFNAA